VEWCLSYMPMGHGRADFRLRRAILTSPASAIASPPPRPSTRAVAGYSLIQPLPPRRGLGGLGRQGERAEFIYLYLNGATTRQDIFACVIHHRR